ncbi:MAG: hypothetical protein EGR87_02490 [Sutterella wadsworthensis]|nr:hypothetical protein [Sutterella wadsworthensis]
MIVAMVGEACKPAVQRTVKALAFRLGRVLRGEVSSLLCKGRYFEVFIFVVVLRFLGTLKSVWSPDQRQEMPHS